MRFVCCCLQCDYDGVRGVPSPDPPFVSAVSCASVAYLTVPPPPQPVESESSESSSEEEDEETASSVCILCEFVMMQLKVKLDDNSTDVSS